MGAKENEAIARRGIEAWNANDWETMERDTAPGIEVVAPEGWPESGRFVGWPAVRRQFQRLKESWSEERIEITEIESAGDQVLATTRWVGKGDASGLDLDLQTWAVYTMCHGKTLRIEFFLDGGQARRAAGLEPRSAK